MLALSPRCEVEYTEPSGTAQQQHGADTAHLSVSEGPGSKRRLAVRGTARNLGEWRRAVEACVEATRAEAAAPAATVAGTVYSSSI